MYIELHCHSAFSFLDGASLPEQLALTASQLGYPALALTDHNGLYGSMAFAQGSQKLGLQAITGAELTLLDGSHVTLLAETPEGYANLCRLITEAHLGRADRRDPRLDFASLEARHAGLIVLSGCRNGLVAGVLRRDGPAAARRFAERCRAVFGPERFFVELQRNYVRGDRALTMALKDLADSVQLGVVASCNVHYHKRERHRLHDVLFRDCPDAVANTVQIAERCRAFDLTRDLGYSFPDFRGADLTPAPRALAELCRAKLDVLYPAAGSPRRGRAAARARADTHQTPSTQWILPRVSRPVRPGPGSGGGRAPQQPAGACQPAPRPRARLVGVVDRVLSARPVAHRSDRERAVPGTVLERHPRLGAGHRSRFPTRDPRGADPAGLQTLRRRARRAGVLVPHLPPALDGTRNR